MAASSMTYCRNAPPRCRFEQIALIIIAFLVYAEAIRNSAPHQPLEDFESNEDDGAFTVDLPVPEEREATQQVLPQFDYDYQGYITRPPASVPPTEQMNEGRHSDFRPSKQILDFTASDATSTQNDISPSYQYDPEEPQNREQSSSMSSQRQRHNNQQYKNNNNINAQFSFPTENSNGDAHFDGNDFKGIKIVGSPTPVPPAHLPTTPIFSYHDPYSYQTHQASAPSSASAIATASTSSSSLSSSVNHNHRHQENDIIYTASDHRGISNYQHEDEPQSYTVQSTLIVGNNANRGHGGDVAVEAIQHDSDVYRPLSSPNNEYKRPGYVFDEQIRPNYMRQQQQQEQEQDQEHHQQQQHQRHYEQQFNIDGKQQRLSYDSHDYPPPSYYQRPTYHRPQQQRQQQKPQRHQQQHSAYLDAPQRQDFGLNSISQPTEQLNVDYINVASTPPTPSTNSNYANNFENYLPIDANQQDYANHNQQYQQQQQQQQQQKQHHHQQHQHPYTSNYRPSYIAGNDYPNQRQQFQHPSAYRPAVQPSNYYEYQLGEIGPPPPPPPIPHQPPQHNYYPNYGLQRPTEPPSGLASLASLFTTTQQYAPQFTNLLLGALTGGTGGGGGGGFSSLAAGTSSQQQQRPINMQLIKALENIARNDDLQCVPKVLCQTIAGQTQRGQLPSFITSPAITNFLTGFPAASPALIYGRAALLGISGGERSCSQTYARCPKSEYEILHYLNNHRGGFFKFFSEPDEQSPSHIYDGDTHAEGAEQAPSMSLLSILSALTGNPAPIRRQTTTPTTTTTTTTQRPLAASLDFAGGIGNFFTQMISEYLSGVEHQRRRLRRSLDPIDAEVSVRERTARIIQDEDFHDIEDSDDTATATSDDTIQYDDEQYDDIEARIVNTEERDGAKFFPEENGFKKSQRKLQFPSSNVMGQNEWVSFSDDNIRSGANTKSNRRGKKMHFENHKDASSDATEQFILFPDHYEQKIRKGRILNRPKYADLYNHYDNEDRFVLSNTHRKPHSEDFENGAHATSELSTASSHFYIRPSTHEANDFRPTPLPPTRSSISNYNNYNYNKNYYYNNNKKNNNKEYNYPNKNYVSNDHRYSSHYQRPKIATTATTTRPRHKDDPNIYVTNRNGVTEFYITPDGRKIYL